MLVPYALLVLFIDIIMPTDSCMHMCVDTLHARINTPARVLTCLFPPRSLAQGSH